MINARVIRINGVRVGGAATFQVDRYPNIPVGGCIFADQHKIPHYDSRYSYVVEAEGERYDIDRIGWAKMSPIGVTYVEPGSEELILDRVAPKLEDLQHPDEPHRIGVVMTCLAAMIIAYAVIYFLFSSGHH